MSGVCAKHDRYVQPGEVCPYCEPAYQPGCSPGYDVPAPLADMIAARIAEMEANAQSNAGLLRLMCDHKNRSVNRDACEDCGMSGMAIMQQRTATAAAIKARWGTVGPDAWRQQDARQIQDSMNRLWAQLTSEES